MRARAGVRKERVNESQDRGRGKVAHIAKRTACIWVRGVFDDFDRFAREDDARRRNAYVRSRMRLSRRLHSRSSGRRRWQRRDVVVRHVIFLGRRVFAAARRTRIAWARDVATRVAHHGQTAEIVGAEAPLVFGRHVREGPVAANLRADDRLVRLDE